MKFQFKDIMDPSVYADCAVMVVTGPYNIFNNLVIDELRERCKGNTSIKMDSGLLEEFGIETNEEIQVSNSVDFETFRNVINMPSINGKWFSNTDILLLTKKQRDWLNNYIVNPSLNGVLTIFANEYKDYKKILTNKTILNSKYVHVIQMSFPTRDSLKYLTRKLFAQRNAKIEEGALDLFITRMSNSYDKYEEIIDRICLATFPEGYLQMNPDELPAITYQQAFECMKGIENFVIEDFLDRLTMPLNSDKLSGRGLIYKMLGYLIEEYGPKDLVKRLLNKIDTLIQFRLAINEGYIPILVNFNVEEAKTLLGEESSIAKLSDYQFRKNAQLASKTSLRDWVYMKMILSNIRYIYSKESYEKALYSLVVRSTLNESRINNDIGIENILQGYTMPKILETS